ncbi:MAG: hypothetical protein ACD_24C00034G0002 [uncultured bacterium]|uniref:Methyltransferase FkbM domain-containing protein n=1 Tax=candidate division WWE3 bacterium RBG_16_37_10 TaxID=1802610 RepID=A0A1F4UWP8_UNCKA|nr:MAG: hypothetical protein ACD_24C00034G0002 [uncultured bacterium]OGC49316.1 MAG: hypothetical protein A2W32_03035 [candidate division WWE3 bacterium RBG_16_37_10]
MLEKVKWFINASISLDLGFWKVSDWTSAKKFEFTILKYLEIILNLLNIKKFRLGESHVTLFGKNIYYDTSFGIAGYQSMLTRHQKMLKFAKIEKVKTVVDIGANVGFFSLVCGDLYKGVDIYAIEPVAKAFECLTKNLTESNYHIFQLAMSDKDGKENMVFTEENTAVSSVIRNETGADNKEIGDKNIRFIEVDAKTLNTFILENNLEVLDILKVDTEFFEYNVLKAACEALKRTRYLHIEISIENNSNYTFSQINSLLYSKDFNFQLVCFRNFTDKGDGPIPVGDFLFKNIMKE